MKKGLIGLLMVSFILVFAVGAVAADFAWSGDASFGIKGASPGAAGDFFGSYDLYLNATLASGAWAVAVEMGKEGEDPLYFDPSITYTGEAFTLTLEDSIDNAVFDTMVTGINANPGIKLEIPMEAFTPYLIVNNCVPAVPGDEVTWSFAGGLDFTAGAAGFGVTFNSNGETEDSSYGVKATYSLDALSLTGQYGIFSPSVGDSGSGYYIEAGYSLAGGGSFTGHYSGADEKVGATANPQSEIYAEFVMPIAESVDFTVDVTNTDDGTGGDTTTAYEAKVGVSF